MPNLVSNISGLNLYTNPLMNPQQDGQILRAVNVDSSPYGAKNKRSGYGTFQAGNLTSRIVDLFSWTPDGSNVPYVYANAGGSLLYSQGGTTPWAICGNGTISGSHMGFSVLNNTLIISQAGGTTRHTTSGTFFADTPGAPAGPYLEQYQQRIYITGTDSFANYSVSRDPTNWSSTGTSDSSNIYIPGAGLPNKMFKLADRLYFSKESRNMFRWDGYSLVDMSTNLGISSPYSYGSVESNGFWINEKGVFTSAGDAPQLISNPIYRFFNNNTGSQIASFGSAPATVHYYDYLCAVGSMTDDLTNETVPNGIIKYNFQKNEFLNWSFANFPTALYSYRDSSLIPQLIFGDASGNIFQYQGTANSDAGQPIEAIIEMMFDFGDPLTQKDWRVLWGFFNPGASAQIAIAVSDTYTKEDKNWQILGDAQEGEVVYRIPSNTRGRFLYVKIMESSRTAPFTLYGIGLDATLVPTP